MRCMFTRNCVSSAGGVFAGVVILGCLTAAAIMRCAAGEDRRLQLEFSTTSGGQRLLTARWPAGFSNAVDLFCITNLLDNAWFLADSNAPTAGRSKVEWAEAADPAAMRFYSLGDAVLDEDNDGIPDDREDRIYHTSRHIQDQDGDGLSDGAEIATGSDPFNRDTDGDGLEDGWEMTRGTSPSQATAFLEPPTNQCVLDYRSRSAVLQKIGFPPYIQPADEKPLRYLTRRRDSASSDVSEFPSNLFYVTHSHHLDQSAIAGTQWIYLDNTYVGYDPRSRLFEERATNGIGWRRCTPLSTNTCDAFTEFTNDWSNAWLDGDGSSDLVWTTNQTQKFGIYDYEVLSTNIDAFYHFTVHEECQWTLTDQNTTPMLEANTRAMMGGVDALSAQPWGTHVNIENGQTNSCYEAQDAWRDLADDELVNKLRRLQYRVRIPESQTGMVYRISVAHFFLAKGEDRFDPTANIVSLGVSNYVAMGTGGELIFNPDGTTVEPPGSNGTVWVEAFRCQLVPDFNRDGVISDADRRGLAARGAFRFWINDDLDIGDDSSEAQDDSPAGSYTVLSSALSGRARNCDDGNVNGLRDLVDFFPIYLDLPIDQFPPWNYTYRLRQQDSAVQYVYTQLGADEVGRIKTERVDTSLETARVGWVGDTSPDWVPVPRRPAATSAPTCAPLDTDWLNGGHRVILIEGAKASKRPLVLEISRNDQVVHTSQLNLSISPVRDMMRYLNVRTSDVLFTHPDGTILTDHSAKLGLWTTSLAEPPNYPDGYYDTPGATLKTLVSTHGLDWDEDETPAGQSEIFKRFFQSGCNARFIGVSWASDMGRRYIPRIGPVPVLYNDDVIGAFVAAHYVKEELNGFWGTNTSIFAHSLGNVLTSSMIADHGVVVDNYFMIDAAVAAEAYDGRPPLEQQVLMMPPEWKTGEGSATTNRYTLAAYSAYWHTLFASGDRRASVAWDNRFANVPTLTHAWNFYSSGEEILRQPNGAIPPTVGTNGISAHEYVWVGNEMRKGHGVRSQSLADWLANIFNSVFLTTHVHGGWGFADGQPNPLDVEYLATEDLIQAPIFTPFETSDERCPLWGNGRWLYTNDGASVISERLPILPFISEPDESLRMNKIKNHAKLLADAIPALSGPTGGRALTSFVDSHSINLQGFVRSGLWPTRLNKAEDKWNRWLHGDYKDLAHVYVYALYGRCTAVIKEGAQ